MLAFAGAPLPPARPGDLVAAAAAAATGAPTPPSVRGVDLIAGLLRRNRLPRAITRGVDDAPTATLALTEVSSQRNIEDEALLSRAAELSAPLPPMPIPTAGLPEKVAARPSPTGKESGDGASAALSGADIARLFGKLPFGAFKTSERSASNLSGLRGSQP